MSDDVIDRMVIYAWDAYQEYKRICKGDDGTDFNSFSVGYFMGAVAASGIEAKAHRARGEK